MQVFIHEACDCMIFIMINYYRFNDTSTNKKIKLFIQNKLKMI